MINKTATERTTPTIVKAFIALALVGAITLLVVGILGSTEVLHISKAGAYAMTAIGGAYLLILTGYFCKSRMTKKPDTHNATIYFNQRNIHKQYGLSN